LNGNFKEVQKKKLPYTALHKELSHLLAKLQPCSDAQAL